MADLSLIPDAAWLEAQRRAEIIRPFAESEHRSRQFVQAAATALGLSERRTYALVRGVGALDRRRARWPPNPICYATTVWRRMESGRPASKPRFSTATPTAASVCWPAKPRARSRGPISDL